MNHFIMLLLAIGFGALAWSMCVASDWLLGDKPRRAPFRPGSTLVAAATKPQTKKELTVSSGAITRWSRSMKKIEAIVRTGKLDNLKAVLQSIGIRGMTLTVVHGRGEQKGGRISYRGIDAELDFVPRMKIELVVADDEEDAIVDAIFQAAHTGEVGDGRILVLDLNSVTRIRTGESIESEGNFIREKRGLQREPLPSQESAFAGNHQEV